MKRIWAILLTKWQRGWKCEVTFGVETDEQFTEVCELHVANSQWLVIAVIKGILGARAERKRINAQHLESRKANGWA